MADRKSQDSSSDCFLHPLGGKGSAFRVLSWLGILFCLFYAHSATGQFRLTDTVWVDEILVTPVRPGSPAGFMDYGVDSSRIARLQPLDMSSLLAFTLPVTVRSYGPGGVGGLSFRGAGPSHTGVVWNGLALNSAMNGQADLSQIPLVISDQIHLTQGMGGGGCPGNRVGGVLSLESQPGFENHLRTLIRQSVCSFSNLNSLVSISAGNGNSWSDSRLYRGSGHYIERRSGPVPGVLAGSLQSSGGLMQELARRFPHRIMARLALWAQEQTSKADFRTGERQEERFQNVIRSLAELKKDLRKGSVHSRVSVQYEKFVYRLNSGNESLIDGTSHSHNIVWHTGGRYLLTGKASLIANADLQHSRVKSPNYTDSRNRRQFDLSAGYQFLDECFSGFASLHALGYDQNVRPFLPSFGVEQCVRGLGDLRLKASYTALFHLPAFNDLYWLDDGYASGNPTLDPEDGYSLEFSLRKPLPGQCHGGTIEAVFFYSKVDRWIIWQPGSDGKWRPENLSLVERMGMEWTGHWLFNFDWGTVLCEGAYSLIQARRIGESEKGSAVYGKQLIYVPRHSANFSLSYMHKGFSVVVSGLGVGERFTSTDNYYAIESYGLLDMSLSYALPAGRSLWTLQAGTRNLGDVFYESVKGYPMPGRTFFGSISWAFNR